jgi:hypothetical protein
MHMAFNPFASFRKNQKFWMGTVLLLCMVTFVLCTGVGGDLSDRIMGWFRSHGQEIATINGRRIYPNEIDQLKFQRNVANDFMREVSLIALEGLAVDQKELRKKNDAHFQIAMAQMEDLKEKVSRPRYFETGIKTEDLLDFIILRDLADERGIRLQLDNVSRIVGRLVHGRFDQHVSREVETRMRSVHYGASDDIQMKALTDEFRVRIVMLELMNSRMGSFAHFRRFLAPQNRPVPFDLSVFRHALTPAQMYDYFQKNRTEITVEMAPLMLDSFAAKQPGPSADKMQAFFEVYLPAEEAKEKGAAKKRPFDEKAAAFFARYTDKTGKNDKYDPAKDVKFVSEMNRLFEKHKEDKYNPTSEKPGFYELERVKIQWIGADADSEYYHDLARTVTALQATPPVLHQPAVPLPFALASYVACSAAMDTQLGRTYAQHRGRESAGPKYMVEGWTERDFAFELYARDQKPPTPGAVATLLALQAEPLTAAAQAAPILAFAAPTSEQIKKWEPLVEAERKKRAPVFATLALAGGPPHPWPLFASYHYISHFRFPPQYLPLLGHVKEEMQAKFQRELAQRWVNKNMLAVKKEIESWRGSEVLFTRNLPDLIRRYGLRNSMGQWRNQYDVAADSGLAPLKAAYEKHYHTVNTNEGRFGKDSMLKPDDFYRLFFENDPIGVGPLPKFKERPWPPTVQVKPDLGDINRDKRPKEKHLFDDAEHPFLFWKTDHDAAKAPPSIADVYKLVEHTYRLSLVRDKIIAEVKSRAEELRNSLKPGKDRRETVRALAKQLNQEAVVVPHVAPLIDIPEYLLGGTDNPKGYIPFELPRSVVAKLIYPRDDLAKLLIVMHGGKEPVKVGLEDLKALDELNKELFDKRGDDTAVQVFTNRPRTVYYISAVVQRQQPNETSFTQIYLAATGQGKNLDMFIDRAQLELGTTFRNQLMEQLRTQANREISDAGRKMIDEDALRGPSGS